MNMTDPIADLLTRIRNANRAGLVNAAIPYSRLKEEVVRVLQEEGFLKSFDVVGEGIKKSLVVTLKYKKDGEKVIDGLKRISKPGQRIYVGYKDLRPIRQGLGTAVLSTPKGVITDSAARKMKLGGEWLCSVW